MQKRATIMIIRAIAIVMAATALYKLFRSWGYYWFLFSSSLQGRCPLEHLSILGLILTLTLALVLVLKLVASYGLLRLQSWARSLAIVVLLFDYALGLVGAIWMCWYSFSPLEPPPIKEGMVQVSFVSMWPIYIIAVVGIVSVFFLTRRWLVSQFKEVAARGV